MKHISVLLLMVSSFGCRIEASFTNFIVKNVGMCNNTQRQIKYYQHVTTEDGKQYITHNITLPFPLGDTTGLICLIQTKTTGTQFMDLLQFGKKIYAKAFNKYLGEFWYDIERHTGITSGVCPIQQGIYHGNHIQLHFDRITLQTFPFGTLKFTLHAIDNSSKDCVWCYWILVENIVN